MALKEVGISFLGLRQLRVMALNVFSLVLFHICFAVLLIHQKGLILTLLIEGRCKGVYILPRG